jgi:hypothetical protein
MCNRYVSPSMVQFPHSPQIGTCPFTGAFYCGCFEQIFLPHRNIFGFLFIVYCLLLSQLLAAGSSQPGALIEFFIHFHLNPCVQIM